MSDEQPASWAFYEADLHTDRLAANKQRQVAKSYRDAYCPNDALPGFAFHQTDRDPTELQKQICSDGRCSNHSRVRDFDLLGYRYSLLSSIGTGGLNNVLVAHHIYQVIHLTSVAIDRICSRHATHKNSNSSQPRTSRLFTIGSPGRTNMWRCFN